MRYAIYWTPRYQSPLYCESHNWFEQTGKFQEIVQELKPQLSYYDFSSALRIPKKYGFHSELLPPFFLKPHIQESDIFDICKTISKNFTQFCLKMSLIINPNVILLRSYHKSNLVIQIKKTLLNELQNFVQIDTCVDYQHDDEFQIVLSHTLDNLLHYNLAKIATIYWQSLLKNPLEIHHFKLCYQKTKSSPFEILMRFDF